MKIAVISAMQEELNRIVNRINVTNETRIGNRTFYEGEFNDHQVVSVFSHWGKVAASMTTTILLTVFKVDKIIFTGVAGSISSDLNIGDIVIGKNLYQHDMDSSPILPKYEIPILKNASIETPTEEIEKAFAAAKKMINDDFSTHFSEAELNKFNIKTPKVIIGDIASADEFVSEATTRNRINNDLPSVVCVEMEGAAVAQVCHDFNIPFVIIRTISDSANDNSHIDFQLFIENIASVYSEKIIEKYLSEP